MSPSGKGLHLLPESVFCLNICRLTRPRLSSHQWLKSSQTAGRPLQEEQTPQRVHLLCGLEPLWAAAGYRLQ